MNGPRRPCNAKLKPTKCFFSVTSGPPRSFIFNYMYIYHKKLQFHFEFELAYFDLYLNTCIFLYFPEYRYKGKTCKKFTFNFTIYSV